MRKFLAALSVALILSGSNVEAAEFTQAQLDKIILIDDGGAKNKFDLDSAQFKEKFNEIITAILKDSLGTDDISAMEHLFLIKDYKMFGETFANIFGDYRVAIVGTMDGGNFTALNFCYTAPEEKGEAIFTAWLMTAFVNTVAPEVDTLSLMNELAGENSTGFAVRGNIKFSIAEDGNLNVLTATAQ